MTSHHNERDPMTGQTFSGMSGSPAARMPDLPPRPQEGGDRRRTAGLLGSILLLILVLVLIIIF